MKVAIFFDYFVYKLMEFEGQPVAECTYKGLAHTFGSLDFLLLPPYPIVFTSFFLFEKFLLRPNSHNIK